MNAVSVPPVLLDPTKGTRSMLESLQTLRNVLDCPLCHQLLHEPSTLTCGHTFCCTCIDHYTCNAWTCPVKDCNFPITVTGERNGKFRKINPTVQTVATSWANICAALEKAPSEWWKDEDAIEQHFSQQEHQPMDSAIVFHSSDEKDKTASDNEGGEMIDLQALQADDDSFATAATELSPVN
jgi:hypothetical protein